MTSNYMPRVWEPYLPGSDISRMEFLLSMREIWESPLSSKEAFLSETLRKLTKPGVLNARQISSITGHGTEFINTVAELMRVKLPVTRAIFDPEMLPLMLECCHRLAQGTGVPRDQLDVLSQTVGPKLLEALVGIPAYVLHEAAILRRHKELNELHNTEAWEARAHK